MKGIQLGADYDLMLNNGQLVVGEITPQNQALILIAHKGEYKNAPNMGVGLEGIINDHDKTACEREIAEAIRGDGQRIDKLKLTESGLTLEASYIR